MSAVQNPKNSTKMRSLQRLRGRQIYICMLQMMLRKSREQIEIKMEWYCAFKMFKRESALRHTKRFGNDSASKNIIMHIGTPTLTFSFQKYTKMCLHFLEKQVWESGERSASGA